jgi:hypothetical protein
MMNTKFYKSIIVTLSLLLITSALFSQSFEGQIKYKMSYQGLPPEIIQFESMLPTEAIATIKGDMFKMEQPMGMGMKQISIMDNKEESGILLLDMMGSKKAVIMTPEKRKEFENSDDTKVEYIDGTKNIAGYTCKKAIIKSNDSQEAEIDLVVYYTEDIKGVVHHQTKGVKGFPLEYTIQSPMFSITMSAQSVTKSKIDENEFSIPPGYENITFEQLQKSMGQ